MRARQRDMGRPYRRPNLTPKAGPHRGFEPSDRGMRRKELEAAEAAGQARFDLGNPLPPARRRSKSDRRASGR